MSCPFSKDLEVFYEDLLGRRVYGYIRFICDEYVTVCIKESPCNDHSNDVCILFYPSTWDKLIPVVSKRTQ